MNWGDVMDFVKEFDNAIKNGYIIPYFQPLTRSITGKVCGAEALARWIDPNKGVIQPNEFIPLLEENNLIYKLDLVMIENVCKFYNENKIKNLCFSINISRLDFKTADMFKLINDIMNKYNVPREAIHLEITESIMFDNKLDINDLFERFHNNGFEIWIDDFGSGFSSLHVLREYKFDVLKIDMSLVQRFDLNSKKILYSIINMAKKLGMRSVAEGVETKEQYKFLKDIGCEIIQGYYFSKPMPGNDFLKYLDINGNESKEDYNYWNEIGKINFLSANPFKFDKFKEEDIFDVSPLALIEYDSKKLKYVYVNDKYLDELKIIGFNSIEKLEEVVNNENYENHTSLLEQIENSIANPRTQRVDNIINNVVFSHFTKLVSKTTDRCLIVSSFSTISTKRTDFLVLKYSQSLYKTYDLVTEITPSSDSAVQIYSTAGFSKIYGTRSLKEGIKEFASKEVLPSDKERYLEFFNLKKIENMKEDYIQDRFMIRSGNTYKLKNVRISKLYNGKFLYTIQSL